jgi:hypothetical protein
LNTILNDLDNPDARIRKAAVEDVVQFESPDAIPALKAAMAATDDLDEKMRLKKAVDFLTPDAPDLAANPPQ